MAIEFNSSDWEFTYGTAPRGHGFWIFSTKRRADIELDSKYCLMCHGTLTEAKKQARELVAWKRKHENWPDHVTLYLQT